MENDTLKKRLKRRFSTLKNERSSWDSHWKDLSSYILPRKSRFLVSNRNDGRKKTNNIIDNTGTLASRTLSAGMMGGITSPSRPWFRLATPSPASMKSAAVRSWLSKVELILREIFHKSNAYQGLHALYGEHGTFGTAVLFIEEDFEDVIRCHTFTVGSYVLGTDERGSISTLYREIEMTVEQVVKKFGLKECSDDVREKWKRGSFDTGVTVYHVVEPNHEQTPGYRDAKGMPWRSIWYEAGAEDGQFLSIKGFQEKPFMAPRWEVTGTDVYGSASPGMVALGDIKQLQQQQRKKAVGIERLVDPPLQAPSSMRQQEVNTLPGGVTHVDSTMGTQAITPLYEVRLDIAAISQDIMAVQNRINSAFYADLFLMLANSDRRQITATEVAERHEEKLLMLGSMLERLQDELLDPLIDRTFAIALRAGILPDPPEELSGAELRVEYISILAQAQKSVAVGAIERVAGFVGNLAGVQPEALDKLNVDKMVDDYTEFVGAPPDMLNGDEVVDQIREQRAQQMAQQQAMEAGQQGAQAAKLLSEADTGGNNVLSSLLGGGGG